MQKRTQTQGDRPSNRGRKRKKENTLYRLSP